MGRKWKVMLHIVTLKKDKKGRIHVQESIFHQEPILECTNVLLSKRTGSIWPHLLMTLYSLVPDAKKKPGISATPLPRTCRASMMACLELANFIKYGDCPPVPATEPRSRPGSLRPGVFFPKGFVAGGNPLSNVLSVINPRIFTRGFNRYT